MRVTRTRFSNGVAPDQIACIYTKDISVVQRNNPNWPQNGFILDSVKWRDGTQVAPIGHEYLKMFGAEILLLDGGDFIATGFVCEEQPATYRQAVWTMERWIVEF